MYDGQDRVRVPQSPPLRRTEIVSQHDCTLAAQNQAGAVPHRDHSVLPLHRLYPQHIIDLEDVKSALISEHPSVSTFN